METVKNVAVVIAAAGLLGLYVYMCYQSEEAREMR